MNCPNCGARIKKGPKGPDKHLLEDERKAEQAVAVLERRLIDGRRYFPDLTVEGFELMQEAMRLEMLRMMRAITDPKMLWGIYRRADKRKPYWEVES